MGEGGKNDSLKSFLQYYFYLLRFHFKVIKNVITQLHCMEMQDKVLIIYNPPARVGGTLLLTLLDEYIHTL